LVRHFSPPFLSSRDFDFEVLEGVNLNFLN
jgi:hypothetical protein